MQNPKNIISKNPPKVCFISGRYRPGKCGISDYIDLLRQNLKAHSIDSKHFSIDDLANLDLGTTQLPDAEFYSLQFAPFAFSSAFLFRKKLKPLQQLINGKKLHINFHEIWVGAYPSASLEEKLRGWIQKIEIFRFIKSIEPLIITTSNSAAIHRFADSGIQAQSLYLFGNIPYYNISKKTPKEERIRVAFFGSLYQNFPYHKLIDYLKALFKLKNQKFEIVLLGRQRDNYGTQRLYNSCKPNKISIHKTGDLTRRLISEELQSCLLGVSTTPYDVIGKSGATAAMLEHGLPVLAYNDGDTPKEYLFIPAPFKDQIFLINDHYSLEKLLQFLKKPRKSFFDGVAYTANKMLELSF